MSRVCGGGGERLLIVGLLLVVSGFLWVGGVVSVGVAGGGLVCACLWVGGVVLAAGVSVSAWYPGWLVADGCTGAVMVLSVADRKGHGGRERRSVLIRWADAVGRLWGVCAVRAGEWLAVVGGRVAQVVVGGRVRGGGGRGRHRCPGHLPVSAGLSGLGACGNRVGSVWRFGGPCGGVEVFVGGVAAAGIPAGERSGRISLGVFLFHVADARPIACRRGWAGWAGVGGRCHGGHDLSDVPWAGLFACWPCMC